MSDISPESNVASSKSPMSGLLFILSGFLLAIALLSNLASSGSSDAMTSLAIASGKLESTRSALQVASAVSQVETVLGEAMAKPSILVPDRGIAAARDSTKVSLAKIDLIVPAQKDLRQAIGQARASLKTIKTLSDTARDDAGAPAWVKTQAIQIIEAVGRVTAVEQSQSFEIAVVEKDLSTIMKAQASSRGDLSRDLDVVNKLVGRSLERLKSIVPSEEENNSVLQSMSALTAAVNQTFLATSQRKSIADWLAIFSSLGLFSVVFTLSLKKSEGSARIVGYNNREAITRLTEDIRRVAGGDLSRDASTAEPSTHLIATELNLAIESWRLTIGQVGRNAASVEQRVASTRDQAEKAKQRSERQERETNSALSSVKKVAALITGITQDSLASEHAAKTALEAVYTGSRAVQSSVDKMRLIREGIQQNELRIKRLGDRSREIDAVTDILASVFEQINVLAVNASVEGTRAGEVGRRFLVVAREIQLLSDKTEKALGKISNLVKTIQAETSQASDLMEVSTRNAREGESIAQMAAASLEVIETVTKGLASMVEHISEATREQSEQVAAVSGSMENVLSLAHEVSESAVNVTTNVDDIGHSMKQLNESVREFKVGQSRSSQ
jgi:methyl-accepting chemotaxis protein